MTANRYPRITTTYVAETALDVAISALKLIASGASFSEQVAADALKAVVGVYGISEVSRELPDWLPLRLVRRIKLVPCLAPTVQGSCWEWQGAVTSGYGEVSWKGSPSRTVHVLVYKLSGRTIPEGYTLDHLCRYRRCCNPQHLEPVTRKVNCLPGDNLVMKRGRKCKTCHRERARQRR